MNIPEVGHVLWRKYAIIRLLGKGGMSAVFEAENKLTGRRVAIKWLAPEFSTGGTAARLVRQAQAAARVRHLNVVDVYDVEREGDAIFLVMELLEGETLKHTMSRRDLAMHQLIALLLPALRGVAAAHRQGVVHHDIRPENIFIAREAEGVLPVPKVLDFGISRLEERDPFWPSLTGTGSTVGTLRYMSYEQLAGAKDIDGRADVYAFGVILYEGLTGRLPFDAESMGELAFKMATGVVRTPHSLRAEIPASLSRIIMRAIARQRDERTASVETLIRELEPFASEQGFTAELMLGDTASPERKAEGHVPPKAKTGLLSQTTNANTVHLAFPATKERASTPLSRSARPRALFGRTPPIGGPSRLVRLIGILGLGIVSAIPLVWLRQSTYPGSEASSEGENSPSAATGSRRDAPHPNGEPASRSTSVAIAARDDSASLPIPPADPRTATAKSSEPTDTQKTPTDRANQTTPETSTVPGENRSKAGELQPPRAGEQKNTISPTRMQPPPPSLYEPVPWALSLVALIGLVLAFQKTRVGNNAERQDGGVRSSWQMELRSSGTQVIVGRLATALAVGIAIKTMTGSLLAATLGWIVLSVCLVDAIAVAYRLRTNAYGTSGLELAEIASRTVGERPPSNNDPNHGRHRHHRDEHQSPLAHERWLS